MHELPLAKSIFSTVIKKAEECGATAVVRVCIEAGELREYVEMILQKYWDYISRGSIAEGAKIELISIPATARCTQCGTVYGIEVDELADAKCPACGYDRGELLTGRELRIKGMEIR